MDIESLRDYCLAKPGVAEGFPFGEDTLVFKVGGKIFALANLEGDLTVNLKCDPERAVALREKHACILPGYHMNKRHWNTILLTRDISDVLVRELIDHSYELVAPRPGKRKL